MESKKIVITGANGFVGSTVVDKALEKGFEVWAGIRSTSSCEFLQDKRIRFVDFHYSDVDILTEQLNKFKDKYGKIDYIVHIAGITKAKNKSDFEQVNFHNTKNFVDALIKSDSIPENFILMSSLSAFGPGDEVNYRPIQPDSIPNPNTAYGKSKLLSENYLKSIPNFPYIILRPTGVYGPRDRDYLILFKTVKSGINISLSGSKQILTFIFSEDLADVVIRCCEKGVKQKEYFVSDGKDYTDTEFMLLVKKILGKKRLLTLNLPLWLVKIAAVVTEKVATVLGRVSTFNTDKYNIMKQRNWSCDTSWLKNDLDFEPKYLLEAGLRKAVKWYKSRGWL